MDTRLIEFVVRNTDLEQDEIKPSLRLAEDMGYYGMDAVSFMQTFFTEFQIPNPEDFDLDAHIDGGPEFVPRPINWFKNIVIKERRKYLKPDVTLDHLDKVASQRKWFNEK